MTTKVYMKPETVYFSDNGLLICSHCAGASAKFTGRDISGQRIARVTPGDAKEWQAYFGEPLKCERGCTTYVDK